MSAGDDRRYRVLISAYACEPGKGSESAVGWNLAVAMAAYHDVWVLTRSNNRQSIERELMARPVPGLSFIYHDLPAWLRWWKKGSRGVRLYYALWQRTCRRKLIAAHRQHRFDLTHHVTLVKYWSLTGAAIERVPFVWGFVGGGDHTPKPFLCDASVGGWLHEKTREFLRYVSECNPALRRLAKNAAASVAVTPATADRLRALGAKRVLLLSQVGLSREELDALAQPAFPSAREFLFAGNLIFLKGVHLGLRAFAEAGLPDWTFRIVGDGSERTRLKELVRRLGIADRVVFEGRIPRDLMLKRMLATGALVHPSLHDSGAFVCVEAMAAGKPVICLNLGGPAVQVTPETGIRVEAFTPAGVVHDMAVAMRRLAYDPELRQRMGDAGRARAQTELCWEQKARCFHDLYHSCVDRSFEGSLKAE